MCKRVVCAERGLSRLRERRLTVARAVLQGFFLAVNLKVHSAPLKEVGLSDEQIHKLVEEAHKLCPYSRAFKGNVDVKLSVSTFAGSSCLVQSLRS